VLRKLDLKRNQIIRNDEEGINIDMVARKSRALPRADTLVANYFGRDFLRIGQDFLPIKESTDDCL